MTALSELALVALVAGHLALALAGAVVIAHWLVSRSGAVTSPRQHPTDDTT